MAQAWHQGLLVSCLWFEGVREGEEGKDGKGEGGGEERGRRGREGEEGKRGGGGEERGRNHNCKRKGRTMWYRYFYLFCSHGNHGFSVAFLQVPPLLPSGDQVATFHLIHNQRSHVYQDS